MRFILTLALVTSLLVAFYWYEVHTLPSYFYETLILLLIGTVGLYFYLVDIKKERSEFFVQLYIATLFAKILAYGAYVLFMVWDDKAQAGDNALFFMVTYFLFTVVEIIFLYVKVSR